MGINVFVVDQERTFADAIAIRLDAEDDLEVVGTVHTDAPSLSQIVERGADVVLFDGDLQNDTAVRLREELAGLDARPRLVLLSCTSEPERIAAAVRTGAAAWVRKDDPLEYLLGVIRGVARGETWLPPAETRQVLRVLLGQQSEQRDSDRGLALLTPREREILSLLAEGTGRREVAERLYLSPNTVRTHVQNLMVKLGVRSTLEAVAVTRSQAGQHSPEARSRK